jgi:hypothetical protein
MLPKITIATSIRYGNYQELMDDTLDMVKSIVENFPKVHKYINLPENLIVHLRPMRNLYGRAFYTKNTSNSNKRLYIVEIDVRQGMYNFYDTLIHELIHIEQFFENRLKNGHSPNHFKWNGNLYKYNGLSLEDYCALPWEAEAMSRTTELLPVIF